MKKLNVRNSKYPSGLFLKIIFYLVFYYSSILLYLTYDIVQSPDFEKYYSYFIYYSGDTNKTYLEQGHFYYYLNYIFSLIIYQLKSTLTLNEIFNLSIHFTNSSIFLFGCKGLVKYISLNKNSFKNIYIVLTVICILPSSIVLRSTFKPEILAFASLGWLAYYLHTYSSKKKLLDALKFGFLFSIVITSKISIGLIISFILILEILINHQKIVSRKLLIPLMFIFIFTSALSIENYLNNGLFITQTKHDEKYDNTASYEFFKNFDSSDFINNPNKYFYYDSFIGIVMFDTFNDFFGLYWNSEHTELNNSRKEFIKVIKKNNPIFPIGIVFDKANFIFTISGDADERWKDEKFIDELRMRSSFYLSIIFYLLTLFFSIFKKNKRIYIISPLIGLIFLVFSSLGIFGTNNFDPLTGDSFKSFYIGFLIIFSFSLVFFELLSKNYFKKSILFITPILFLFYLGFPMDYDNQNEINIIYKNSLLPTCIINGPIINGLLNIEKNISCNEITDYKEIFYPVTTVDRIQLRVANVPYFHFLTILILFIFRIIPSKLFIANKNLKL